MIKKLLTLMMAAMVISSAVQVPSMAASKTVVVTVAATDITALSAKLGGKLTSIGKSEITRFGWEIENSAGVSRTGYYSQTSGFKTGVTYVGDLPSILTPDSKYSFRAFAEDADGNTYYGKWMKFSTPSLKIKVTVNGAGLDFDGGTPFEDGGRAFLPVETVAEAYGAETEQTEDETLIFTEGVTVRVPVGESYILRNNDKILTGGEAVRINGLTYLPVTEAMEALGAKVSGDGLERIDIDDDYMSYILEIENSRPSSNYWADWSSAISLHRQGRYEEAVELYRGVIPGFLKEGKAVNNALGFMRLADSLAMMGEFMQASYCYRRSSYYWYQDPVYANDQTALRYANLADTLECKMELYLKTDDPSYDRTKYFGAPYEPETGLLRGAYAEGDKGAWDDDGLYYTGFERMTGSEHGLFLLYLHDNQDIAHYATHFAQAKKTGSVVMIALEPNQGINSSYLTDKKLTDMAKYMEESGCKFLLRFANEMNEPSCTSWYTDHETYVKAYRRVADIFRRYAPSVGLVWAPNFFPQEDIEGYYPGDEYVDYVGVSAYEEHDTRNDPAGEGEDRDHWINILENIYRLYGDRKPIIVSEGGVGYQSIYTGEDVTDFAAEQMREYYTYLPIRFPNLKMAVLFDADESGAAYGYYTRKFMLSKNSRLLEAYSDAVSSSRRYIGGSDESGEEFYYGLYQNVSLPAENVELCGFVSYPDDGCEGVAYYIDGKIVGESYEMPYAAHIDLRPYSGRTVELAARAIGVDGLEKTVKIRVGQAPETDRTTASLVIKGKTDTDNTVVAAAYSADGELLCCKTFTPSGTGSDRVVLSADRDVDRVKVFEWDGTGGMRPAGRSVSYPV